MTTEELKSRTLEGFERMFNQGDLDYVDNAVAPDAVDPEIAVLERGRTAQRLGNYRHAARLLADRGALRPGMTIDGAAAAIFALGHPETYRALVLDGDWNDDAWANWLHATLEAALLGTD